MIADERGSMVPLMGGLLFIAFAVVGLAVDVALLHGAYVRASAVADHAAEAAAAMIDVDAAHDGSIVLDHRDAAAVAERTLADNGWNGSSSVEVSGAAICVEVEVVHHTVALGFIGMPTVDVATVSCAEPATG